MTSDRPVILITGCSSGIGLDAARTLTARGWRVLASCRRPEDCAAREAEGLESFVLDVADPASGAAARPRIEALTGGRLDALFNNAGIALPAALEDLPREALREIFETNVFGTHDLTRSLLPLMHAQGHGRIITCSSVLGVVPRRWRGAYVASKYALEGWADVLRIELRDTPIKVVLIQPGPITSRFRINSIPLFERWIDWRASRNAARYESALVPRLYQQRGPDRFERPAAAVSRALVRALESASPAPRYRVTIPAHLMAALRRMLPTRALDWLISRE